MKRTFDILSAAIGILFLSPLLLSVMCLIRVTSRGPIFFRQRRIGQGMRPFYILKFRTMVHNADSIGTKITVGQDSRITPVGRFLRKTKIDELPQLFNVFFGDMSIVGPRPEVPQYVNAYPEDFQKVLVVRPGITDQASIKFRDEASLLAAAADPEREYVENILPNKLALAKEYVKHASFLIDLRLILQTIFQIVRDRLNQQDAIIERSILPKTTPSKIPFFRASITDAEIGEVVDCLKSGWLTTGPRVQRFEKDFAKFTKSQHAVAVNSCTAALHLAVEALGLRPKQGVLVPSMTFAATAEVIRYMNAIPILVDSEPNTLNINLEAADQLIDSIRRNETIYQSNIDIVGIIPVHVGGLMVDMNAVKHFAKKHNLWVVEDAAHALPASFRSGQHAAWQMCGENTADVTCFSFYANKTITTGEGGMAVTDNAKLADRMRQMALHGLSRDAWTRYSGDKAWDYKILAPGYKYNMSDIAAAIGIHQLQKAEAFRLRRQELCQIYINELIDCELIELPADPNNRIHSWHLFPIRLHLEKLDIDRDRFLTLLKSEGVGCSVHWRPLHLHPYYRNNHHAGSFPVVTKEWTRLISLPLFPDMTAQEAMIVCGKIRLIAESHKNRLTENKAA